jgi:alpha-beta hydrolase superfamily lysophospholipase
MMPALGSADADLRRRQGRTEVVMSTTHTGPKSAARAATMLWATLALTLITTLALAASGCGRRNALAPEAPPVAGAASRVALASPTAASAAALHLTGVSESGALWAIDRPAGWNGDLVVYVHGYTDPAAPVAMPNYGELRDSLLARGYAVAASSFSSNGYAVAEGMRESHALTGIYRERAGHARRTYLVGKSLGGLIAMLMTQKYPEQYDGSLLVSGIVGGSTEEVQYMGDVRVLFDAVYPGVLAGGLYHPPVISDLNAQVVLPVMRAITLNPQGVGIIQALSRRKLPGDTPQEIGTSLVTMLGFSMQGGGDLYARAHGHSYFDNADWRYDSPMLPPALVADINARVARHTREPDAANFLERAGEPTGPFAIPVLTLHSTRDPVVPVFHEDVLARVAVGEHLRQERVARYGHVPFSTGEILSCFGDLVRWVEQSGIARDGRLGGGARPSSEPGSVRLAD